MKRVLVFCLLLLLILPGFVNPAFAADSPVFSASKLHFELEPFVTLGAADLQEFVCYGTLYPEYANEIWSRLDWDLDFLSRVGLSCAGEYSFLHLWGDFSFFFPKCSGAVNDFDWRDKPDTLSDYSCHFVEKSSGITAEFGLGFDVAFFSDAFKVIPFAGIGYRNLLLTGVDGYGYYKDTEWAKKTFSGDVLSYNQSVAMVRTGLRLEADLADKFTLRLSGEWAPYLECMCEDMHLSNTKTFKDFFEGKGAMAFSGNIGIKTSAKGQLCFGINYQRMPTVKGVAENGYDYFNYPRTNYSIWETSLSYRIRIV